MAASVGERAQVDSRAGGGSSLFHHSWSSDTESAIREGGWDVVVLQERGNMDVDSLDVMMVPAVRALNEWIVEAGARPLLWMMYANHEAFRAGRFDEDQTKVSKHLAVLRKAGLVTCEVDGRCRIYALADAKTVRKILDCLEKMQMPA